MLLFLCYCFFQIVIYCFIECLTTFKWVNKLVFINMDGFKKLNLLK